MPDIEIMAELRGKKVDDIDLDSPEEIRHKTPDELQHFVEVIDAHLRTIHQDDNGELRDKTPAEQTAFDYGLKLRDLAITRIDEHRAVQEVFRRRPKAVETAMLNLGRDREDPYGDVRRLTTAQTRDLALRALDDRNNAAHLRTDEKDEVERQIRNNSDVARRILVTENEHYRTAFMKLVTKPSAAAFLSEDERHALQAYDEYRAGSEGTTTAGGFGIPVFIDPSIILTAQGSGNPFLQLARQVDINTNIWKGVSSSGVTWAFQAEAAPATDNMATLAQPSVTVFMARGFIPYSISLN
jgi:HK97 family phage major capsid protein